MNSNINQGENIDSTTIDLENLRKKYSNLLLKYQQAVAEYTTYLNEQPNLPCKKFSLDSKDIDQDCINYVLKKSGCEKGSLKPTPDDVKNRSLGEFIAEIWWISTVNSPFFKEKCYGTSTKYNTSTSPDFNINAQSFATIKGQAFNGTGMATSDMNWNRWNQASKATTLQECIASCSTSPNCTGATFVSNKCNIRTGDSPLISSSPDSYAIIPKGKQLLFNMEDINKQLLDVNTEISNKIEVSEPIYDVISEESYLKNKELIDNYEELLEERRTIEETLKEYETLENAENENQIKTTKNYYTYILLLIIALAIIIFLYRMFGSGNAQVRPIIQSGGELGSNAYYIVFGLIIFVIILRWSINYLSV
jgi:hypothetical protein